MPGIGSFSHPEGSASRVHSILMRFRDLIHLPDDQIDLARAALLLATLEAPNLDTEPWLTRLDGLADAAREHAGGASGDFARLEALTGYLYGELGFRGNKDDYYDPRNSFLHQVVERRLGIPISLAVLLIEVGKRAGVPLFGVGLPGHFLVRHARHPELLLDPFDGGRILTRGECAEILRKALGEEASFQPQMLRPVGHGRSSCACTTIYGPSTSIAASFKRLHG